MNLGVITAVIASGYGVMFTVLDDYRDRFGISESRLGMIVGIGFLSSFLAQVFLAPLADRGHARAIVVVGLLLNFCGLMTLAFGRTTVVLLLGRFVMGIGLGLAFPAIRRLVILGDPQRLGDNLGLLLAADVTGFAAGFRAAKPSLLRLDQSGDLGDFARRAVGRGAVPDKDSAVIALRHRLVSEKEQTGDRLFRP